MKTLYIEDNEYATRVAYLIDNELWAYDTECKGFKTHILNTIYKCKVVRKIPSLSAAFVDLGQGITGYLSLNKQNIDDVKDGDYCLCQVKRECFGEKDLMVDMQITIPGRYMVYMPNGNGTVNVSNRAEGESVAIITENLKKKVQPNESFILRTAVTNASIEQIDYELCILRGIWDKTLKAYRDLGNKSGAVFEEPELLVRLERDYIPEADNIVTDNAELYRRYKEKSDFYDSTKVSLIANYGITEKVIREGIDSKVILPSGGSLIIEYTEALTIIDVNSGSFVGNMPSEDAALKINLDAAKQISRQLMLRNISGIVVIDFIDMRSEQHKKKLVNALEEYSRHDKAKVTVVDITKLGLVELTRRRTDARLENLLMRPCGICHGTGKRFSEQLISFKLLDNLRKLSLGTVAAQKLLVRASSELYDYINQRPNYSAMLQRLFRNVEITFVKDRAVDEFVIEYR